MTRDQTYQEPTRGTLGDPFLARCRDYLNKRERDGNLNSLGKGVPISARELLVDGITYLNLASNDYLGLSNHAELVRRAKKFAESYGTGTSSSRLIAGNLDSYDRIEEKIARLKGTEAALLFPSGFQLTASVLAALSATNSVFALDQLCHAGILAGVSGTNSRWFRFAHNDFKDLKKRLADYAKKQDTGRKDQIDPELWIVSETVFGLDGNRAPLDQLVSLAASTSSCLYIDESHATGVFGTNGMGLWTGSSLSFIPVKRRLTPYADEQPEQSSPGVLTELHLKPDSSERKPLIISMGTFGKGFGSFGGYLACPELIKQFLINKCDGFINSTPLPPPVLGAIDAALDLIPEMNEDREALAENADWLRTKIKALGFDIGGSSTHIIPIIVGESSHAVALAEHFLSRQLFAPALRPPAVPDRTARVLLSLTSKHTRADLQEVVDALKSWRS